MIYMELFILLYAEDTVLMAKKRTNLQNRLDSFASYCRQWKLNVNLGKTKIAIFGARKLPNLQFKIGSECIEIVKNHKYLGILVGWLVVLGLTAL